MPFLSGKWPFQHMRIEMAIMRVAWSYREVSRLPCSVREVQRRKFLPFTPSSSVTRPRDDGSDSDVACTGYDAAFRMELPSD